MADELDDDQIEGLSFWEPGGYKKTTKRITDGNQLCTDFVEMVQDRCELEANYAASMKSWAKKWGKHIDKGPEYGSMESAWKANLTAADREADVHLRVRDNLIAAIQNEVRRWQKDNYHKSMMSLTLKQKKEMDEEFKKAQKPWAKKLKVVEQCKKEYHVLCQKEQSAIVRQHNAKNDSNFSDDQRAKIEEELSKLSAQKQSARGNYEDALRDLNAYNARYMEDMKEVYMRCQDMENKRLEFFKDRLLAMHQSVDLSNDVVMKQISADYLTTINNADARSDLKWWDMQRGVDMPMSWPQFEEWSPALRDITEKSKFTIRRDGAGSTISREKWTPKTDEPSTVTITTTTTVTPFSNRTENVVTTTRPVNGDAQKPVAASRDNLSIRHSSSSLDNPFHEEFSETADTQAEHSKPGVKVRALYSYSGEEEDELNFKEGDLFEKIAEKDEQGWCKGRKDGKVGLFPADYVENV
ncbi:hypothetical protein RvY_09928 [Ramazzottius varieornatus]|uniref:SH3 domain-containing protein n=1 Tax=Ramazzottius varieornatus TaxID=947166 RepID=A0A1D1VK16_RAMVA|nr:hypothetical protein RvY_09928 [Ramazzottius varieornatus]